MVYGTAARIAIEIARKTLYTGRRIDYTSPSNKFISKFVPPGYRRRAFQINKVAEIATAGGLIYQIATFLSNLGEDSPGNAIQTPFRKQPKTYSPYKTRSRFSTGRRHRRKYCIQPRNHSRFSRSGKY